MRSRYPRFLFKEFVETKHLKVEDTQNMSHLSLATEFLKSGAVALTCLQVLFLLPCFPAWQLLRLCRLAHTSVEKLAVLLVRRAFAVIFCLFSKTLTCKACAIDVSHMVPSTEGVATEQ